METVQKDSDKSSNINDYNKPTKSAIYRNDLFNFRVLILLIIGDMSP